MKRFATMMGVLLLIGAIAVPVIAWGPHWGRGHHMMGYWGNGPEYGLGDDGNLTAEQRNGLDALDSKYYEETEDLRNRLWTKSHELDSVLNSTNPDIERAKALQNEIGELRAKLDEKTLSYELEARTIDPDQPSGSGFGRGYGHHMWGPGSATGYGTHMSGYGPEACWN